MAFLWTLMFRKFAKLTGPTAIENISHEQMPVKSLDRRERTKKSKSRKSKIGKIGKIGKSKIGKSKSLLKTQKVAKSLRKSSRKSLKSLKSQKKSAKRSHKLTLKKSSRKSMIGGSLSKSELKWVMDELFQTIREKQFSPIDNTKMDVAIVKNFFADNAAILKGQNLPNINDVLRISEDEDQANRWICHNLITLNSLEYGDIKKRTQGTLENDVIKNYVMKYKKIFEHDKNYPLLLVLLGIATRIDGISDYGIFEVKSKMAEIRDALNKSLLNNGQNLTAETIHVTDASYDGDTLFILYKSPSHNEQTSNEQIRFSQDGTSSFFQNGQLLRGKKVEIKTVSKAIPRYIVVGGQSPTTTKNKDDTHTISIKKDYEFKLDVTTSGEGCVESIKIYKSGGYTPEILKCLFETLKLAENDYKFKSDWIFEFESKNSVEASKMKLVEIDDVNSTLKTLQFIVKNEDVSPYKLTSEFSKILGKPKSK